MAFGWRRLNGCLEFEDLIGVGVGRRRVGVYVISSIEPMYPYYRAGLCPFGVFRLCLLWPFCYCSTVVRWWRHLWCLRNIWRRHCTFGCASKQNDKNYELLPWYEQGRYIGTLVQAGTMIECPGLTYAYTCAWGNYTPLISGGFTSSEILWNCNGRGVHINFRSTGGGVGNCYQTPHVLGATIPHQLVAVSQAARYCGIAMGAECT